MRKVTKWVLLVSLCFAPEFAQADDNKFYGLIVDLNARLGNNRDIGRVEISAPLLQTKDQLFFADIRTVVSDLSEREGNFGLAYRQVVDIAGNDYIAGGYGFYDRRRSETGKYFSQMTMGAELLGSQWRGRTNFYLPVSNEKTISDQPDTATLTPEGFVLVNPQKVIEVPLAGLDLEFGAKVPFFEDQETWAHLGVYKFGIGDDIVLNGARFRGETQVNEWLRIGVESSYDNVRKDNHFFDIRIRIPLQKKLSKKRYALKESIHRYMQEPIIRDVDIVATNQSLKAALATSNGKPEQYYFVDNTAPAGGDGRPNTPFNTLADAESAVKNDSTIYVRTGDGTTANMNNGITITKNDVRFLGAGIDLLTRDGVLVEDVSTAPKVTHTGGDAITIDGQNVEVAGFNIDSPATDGIFVLDDGNALIHHNTISGAGNNGINATFINNKSEHVSIRDNVISGSTLRGIVVKSYNGGNITANVSGNISTGNTQEGIRYEVATSSGSGLEVISSNNTANTNGRSGMLGISVGDGQLNITSDGDSASNNTHSGLLVQAGGASIAQDVMASNFTANSNGQHGIAIDLQDNAAMTLSLNDTRASNNTSDGLNVISRSNTTLNANVANHTSVGNSQQGIEISANGASTVMNIDLDSLDVSTSGNGGLYFRARSGGTLNASLTNATIDNNTGSGLFVEGTNTADASVQIETTDTTNSTIYNVYLIDSTSGMYNVDLGGGTLGSTGQNRIFNSGNVDVFGNLNGTNIFAQSNWWGTAAGLLAGETTLSTGGSIVSSTQLTADPRP